MSDISSRYRKVADQFAQRVTAVPAEAWSNPSPCEGWTARDVVRHLVESSSFFLERAGAPPVAAPSVDDDPVGAALAVRDAIQTALDDPEIATRQYDTPMGPATLEQTVGMFGIGDVLVHTWDIARATGQDETLDADEVHRLLETMTPRDEQLRSSGMFGPRVEVPDDADEQTKLIAFTGRRP